MKKCLLFIIILICAFVGKAQETRRNWSLDVFMGVDFNYRDVYWNNRVYDVLVNVTPGLRWNLPHRWDIAVQLYVPVINQYGKYYRRVRPRVASASKQLAIGGRWKMKVSGGIFTGESYGFDLKNMYVIKPWLAATVQVGLTGYFSMADGWRASTMRKVTFAAGPEFYLRRWNTQMSFRGGRYLFNDYGVETEAFRHFKHVSVGFFATYSQLCNENAGFKVIVMLPPYKRKNRRINLRLANAFRLTYNVEATYDGMRKYFTDPEENERAGWFDRDLIPWGTDLMDADFRYTESRKKEKK